MKQSLKPLALLLALTLLAACLFGCGAPVAETPAAAEEPAEAAPAAEEAPAEEAPAAVTGTIMLLANTSAGAQYEAYAAYYQYAFENLGYAAFDRLQEPLWRQYTKGSAGMTL